VTGGAGFIGSHLVSRLLNEGVEVRVFDNNWRGSKRNLGDLLNKADFVEGDIRNFDDVEKTTKDIDVIYHLASIQGTKYFYLNPELVLEVGVLGNINIAKAAAKANVERILFSSSSEVYGIPQYFPTDEKHPITIPDIKNPRWSYAIQKITGESIFLNYAKKFGFYTTIVRIHNAYGPRMGWNHVMPEFIRRIMLNEKFIVQGKGIETRAFCFIDDIIDGIFLASKKEEGKNEIFNIGNPNEEITINKLVEKLKKISGKNFELVHVEKPEGSTERRKADISKAHKLLGYEPKVNLDTGLKKTFEWYVNEINWWLENSSPKEYPWAR